MHGCPVSSWCLRSARRCAAKVDGSAKPPEMGGREEGTKGEKRIIQKETSPALLMTGIGGCSQYGDCRSSDGMGEIEADDSEKRATV